MSYCSDHNPDPASPAALWENARGCWQAFALLFGTPLQLLGEVFIRRTERNEANAFLRSLEALVRRLLLAEAVAVIPGEGAERRRPGTQSSQKLNPLGSGSPLRCDRNDDIGDDSSNELDTESTAHWPAHFALRLNSLLGANLAEPRMPKTLHNHPNPLANLPDPTDTPTDTTTDNLPRFDFAAPIALRIEALRRVIATPDAYIRRTARALAAFRRRNRPPILLPARKSPATTRDSFTRRWPASRPRPPARSTGCGPIHPEIPDLFHRQPSTRSARARLRA